MTTKRMLGILLAAVIALTGTASLRLSVASEDAVSAMTRGAAILKAGADTADAATVWYGDSAWRVIGYDGEGIASETGTATLLASGNMGYTSYSGGDAAYDSSILKSRIDDVAAAFSPAEAAAIRSRLLTEANDEMTGGDVNAKLWPLSVSEAGALNRDMAALDPDNWFWALNCWWLRTPGASYGVAGVFGNGNINTTGLSASRVEEEQIGVRPAFRLELGSVLFASPAEGGKQSGEDGSLTAIGNYLGSEWKLTLLDEDRNDFSAELVGTDGDPLKWKIEYSGAAVGENEYISAVIEENGRLAYYGRLCKAQTDPTGSNAAPNTITVDLTDIPVSFNTTNHVKLYLFNEQYNGDKQTDYASALCWIRRPTSMTLEAEDVTVGEDAVVTACLPDSAIGTVTITLDGQNYDADIVDGWVSLTVSGLAAGTYTVEAVYEGDDSFLGCSAETTFTVIAPEPSEEPSEEPREDPSEPSEEPSEPIEVSDSILYGDANSDGSVDMKDVLVMRKFIANMDVSINETAADVNRDGSVDMKDVLLTRKFIAGLIDTFDPSPKK